MAALSGLVSLLAAFTGCSNKPSEVGVLARVGAQVITREDFEKEVQWRVSNQRPLPDKQALLEEMIARETRLQKARALGLENDPEVRREYENMLTARLEEHELTPRLDALKAPPDEVRSLYETNLAHYTRPAKARLALIEIKIDPKLEADKITELQSRINEARNQALTRGFTRVAADFSEDQASRYKGGDVGWFDEGVTGYRWPDEVISAGFALNTNGAISEVIKTGRGFFLVSKLDSRPSVVTPLAQVENSLQRRLLAEKQQQLRQAFERETRAFVPVQTYPQALAALDYPTTTVAKAAEALPPTMLRTP